MELYDQLKKRKYRVVLLRCFYAFKVVFHTVFVILDILSDIYYLSTVTFYNMALKGLCILFIFIIPAIIYSLTLIFLVCKVIKLRRFDEDSRKFTTFTWLWFFFGPALSLIYPAIEKVEMFAPSEYDWLFQLATIEFLMESLPQLLIQGINNSLGDTWNSGTKFSFTISVMSLLRGCYVLSTTWYRRQYEKYLQGIENNIINEVDEKLNNIPNDYDTIDNINKIRESVENLTQYQIDRNALIKFKFYENFHSKKVIFNRNFDDHYQKNKQLHKYIERIISIKFREHENETKLKITCKKLFDNLGKPINILIIIQLVLNFVVWFCNLLYLVIADYKNESLRFLLMFFLSLGYVSSLAGNFKNLNGILFRRFLIFKLCIVSHFDNLVKFLFDKRVESNRKLLFEILPLLICWMPVIIIQGINSKLLNKNDGIYRAVIVLNVLCIVFIFFRIIFNNLTSLGIIRLENEPENEQIVPQYDRAIIQVPNLNQ